MNTPVSTSLDIPFQSRLSKATRETICSKYYCVELGVNLRTSLVILLKFWLVYDLTLNMFRAETIKKPVFVANENRPT